MDSEADAEHLGNEAAAAIVDVVMKISKSVVRTSLIYITRRRGPRTDPASSEDVRLRGLSTSLPLDVLCIHLIYPQPHRDAGNSAAWLSGLRLGYLEVDKFHFGS